MIENKAIEALQKVKNEFLGFGELETFTRFSIIQIIEKCQEQQEQLDSRPVDSPNKEKVFRIIELPTHQVLLSKEYDDEDDIHQVAVSFSMKSANISVKIGAKNGKEDRDKVFDDFSVEQAQNIINKLALDFDEDEDKEGYVNPIDESY